MRNFKLKPGDIVYYETSDGIKELFKCLAYKDDDFIDIVTLWSNHQKTNDPDAWIYAGKDTWGEAEYPVVLINDEKIMAKYL